VSFRRASTFHNSSLAAEDRTDKKTLKELPNDTGENENCGLG